jgi:hypothetical protein
MVVVTTKKRSKENSAIEAQFEYLWDTHTIIRTMITGFSIKASDLIWLDKDYESCLS